MKRLPSQTRRYLVIILLALVHSVSFQNCGPGFQSQQFFAQDQLSLGLPVPSISSSPLPTISPTSSPSTSPLPTVTATPTPTPTPTLIPGVWEPETAGISQQLMKDTKFKGLRAVETCSTWEGLYNADGLPPGIQIGKCAAYKTPPLASMTIRNLPDAGSETDLYWSLNEGAHDGPMTINGVSFPAGDIMVYRIQANSIVSTNTASSFVIEGFNNVGISPGSSTYNTQRFRRVESNRNGYMRVRSNTLYEPRNVALNNGSQYATDTWPHLLLNYSQKKMIDFAMFDKLELDLTVRIDHITQLPGWPSTYQGATLSIGFMARRKDSPYVAAFFIYNPYSPESVNYKEQMGIDQLGQGLYRGNIADIGGVLNPGDPKRRFLIDMKALLKRALGLVATTYTADDYYLDNIGLGFESLGYQDYEFEVESPAINAQIKPIFDKDIFTLDGYRKYNPGLRGSPNVSLRKHWITTGVASGLRASDAFDVKAYLNRYPDVLALCGPAGYAKAIEHYILFGRAEGRIGN